MGLFDVPRALCDLCFGKTRDGVIVRRTGNQAEDGTDDEGSREDYANNPEASSTLGFVTHAAFARNTDFAHRRLLLGEHLAIRSTKFLHLNRCDSGGIPDGRLVLHKFVRILAVTSFVKLGPASRIDKIGSGDVETIVRKCEERRAVSTLHLIHHELVGPQVGIVGLSHADPEIHDTGLGLSDSRRAGLPGHAPFDARESDSYQDQCARGLARPSKRDERDKEHVCNLKEQGRREVTRRGHPTNRRRE